MARSTHRPPYRYMLLRLKEARQESGLSQVEVAEILGTTQTAVSKVERGERRMDPVDLSEYAAVYGKEIGWFLLEPVLANLPSADIQEPQERSVVLDTKDLATLSTLAYERGESEETLLRDVVRKALKRKD